MSSDIYGKVTRDGVVIYPSILFQIERMSAVEAMTYSEPPHFMYDGFCTGPYDLRQNDYIIDLYNTNPVTSQKKAYMIYNEPESFPDGHIEFSCKSADRAAVMINS